MVFKNKYIYIYINNNKIKCLTYKFQMEKKKN